MKRTEIRRTEPMARGAGRMERTPLRKRNPKRQAENFQRAYGGKDRADWFTRQPCIICGALPSVNAHVRTGGTSRKADARWIVPVCDPHHDEMHHGQKSFEAKYGVDLAQLAAIYDARWDVYRAQIDLFTPSTPRPT